MSVVLTPKVIVPTLELPNPKLLHPNIKHERSLLSWQRQQQPPPHHHQSPSPTPSVGGITTTTIHFHLISQNLENSFSGLSIASTDSAPIQLNVPPEDRKAASLIYKVKENKETGAWTVYGKKSIRDSMKWMMSEVQRREFVDLEHQWTPKQREQQRKEKEEEKKRKKKHKPDALQYSLGDFY